MKAVGISSLKAHLSRYVREVKRGGEVRVLERGVPVARLVGIRGADKERDDQGRWARLARAGVLTEGGGDLRRLLRRPPLRLGSARLRDAIDEDREDRV